MLFVVETVHQFDPPVAEASAEVPKRMEFLEDFHASSQRQVTLFQHQHCQLNMLRVAVARGSKCLERGVRAGASRSWQPQLLQPLAVGLFCIQRTATLPALPTAH